MGCCTFVLYCCARGRCRGALPLAFGQVTDRGCSQYGLQGCPSAWRRRLSTSPSRWSSSVLVGAMGAPAARCSPTSYSMSARYCAVVRSRWRTISSAMVKGYRQPDSSSLVARVGCACLSSFAMGVLTSTRLSIRGAPGWKKSLAPNRFDTYVSGLLVEIGCRTHGSASMACQAGGDAASQPRGLVGHARSRRRISPDSAMFMIRRCGVALWSGRAGESARSRRVAGVVAITAFRNRMRCSNPMSGALSAIPSAISPPAPEQGASRGATTYGSGLLARPLAPRLAVCWVGGGVGGGRGGAANRLRPQRWSVPHPGAEAPAGGVALSRSGCRRGSRHPP